jgi:hypothetical protein
MKQTLPTGFQIVTRASLKVKDRRVLPPDRPVFDYHVVETNKEGELEVVQVEGVWGDYLRDLDAGIVVEYHAPLNQEENTEKAVLITDLCNEGIPDNPFVPDPLLPY